MRGLRSLARCRDRRRGRKPALRLLCEVFDSNAAHLGELVEHLEREGVVFDEILFQHLIFNRPEELAAQERVFRDEFNLPIALWRGYGYRPRVMDFAAFDQALQGLRERYPQARFSVDLRGTEALRDYYEGRRDLSGEAFCDGPWTQVNVFPNGDVWLCPDFIAGSLLRDDFAGIWDGPMARALRRRVCQRLFPACRGCFSFYGKEQPLGLERGTGPG